MKSHVELALFGEQQKLVRFERIGRNSPKTSIAAKNRAENNAIDRLQKLDGAVDQRDTDGVAHDDHIFCVRGFCRIHRWRGQCVPHRGRGGGSGRLRSDANRGEGDGRRQKRTLGKHVLDPTGWQEGIVPMGQRQVTTRLQPRPHGPRPRRNSSEMTRTALV